VAAWNRTPLRVSRPEEKMESKEKSMFYEFNIGLTVLLVVVVVIAANALRILREYQRGVVFTLGRFSSVKGPGLIFVIPILQQMVRVDLRTVTMDVPSQDVISRDNVSVKVSAVL